MTLGIEGGGAEELASGTRRLDSGGQARARVVQHHRIIIVMVLT